MGLLFFVLGAAIGSFLNVIAVRYDPRKFLLGRRIVGGRSFCPLCKQKLRWFELIPLISFFLQKGKCRHCGGRISFQYPLVEIITGLVFVGIFISLSTTSYLLSANYYVLFFLWILVFSTLLVLSLIDFRLRLIPNEASIFLFFLGFLLIIFSSAHFGLVTGSFLGSYALLFGWRGNIWLNHLSAALIAGIFFAFLILITRGRGMGTGDLKLVSSLGWIFGWPDIILIVILSFLLGSLAGLGAILFKNQSFKSYLAFAPFLALSSLLVFFWGEPIIGWYFRLF